MKRDANSIRSLVSLGMPERYVEKIHQILHSRSGLIVFSGPTGCGKSTTIYSILNEFDPLQHNIQTAESPIEVVMPHVNQVEISDFGRNTFLNWVRGDAFVDKILSRAPPVMSGCNLADGKASERSRNVRCVFRPKSPRLSGSRPPRLECDSCRRPRRPVYLRA